MSWTWRTIDRRWQFSCWRFSPFWLWICLVVNSCLFDFLFSLHASFPNRQFFHLSRTGNKIVHRRGRGRRDRIRAGYGAHWRSGSCVDKRPFWAVQTRAISAKYRPTDQPTLFLVTSLFQFITIFITSKVGSSMLFGEEEEDDIHTETARSPRILDNKFTYLLLYNVT